MQRVLAVEAAEERHDRLVQHVAVEEELHEAGEQVHHQERGDELPGGGADLREPDLLRSGEPQQAEQAGEREDDRGEEERKRQFFLDVGFGRGGGG